jgi:hypothetical protein
MSNARARVGAGCQPTACHRIGQTWPLWLTAQPSVATVTESDEIGCAVIDPDRPRHPWWTSSWERLDAPHFWQRYPSRTRAAFRAAGQASIAKLVLALSRFTTLLPALAPWSRRANDRAAASAQGKSSLSHSDARMGSPPLPASDDPGLRTQNHRPANDTIGTNVLTCLRRQETPWFDSFTPLTGK